MIEHFHSLDDVAQAYVKATQVENGALFMQGKVIQRAVEQGWEVDEVTAFCSGHVRRSKRTLYRRYAVARTFDNPNMTLPWELYAVAADCVDYRKADEEAISQQQEAARAWIDEALQNDWSSRELSEAINGKTPRKVVLNGVEAEVIDVSLLVKEVRFRVDDLTYKQFDDLMTSGKVKLTVVLDVVHVPALEELPV